MMHSEKSVTKPLEVVADLVILLIMSSGSTIVSDDVDEAGNSYEIDRAESDLSVSLVTLCRN